jgi:hypothetical protein
MPLAAWLGGFAKSSRHRTFLDLVFFLVLFVIVFIVFLAIRILDSGKFEDGQRKGFAKQIALLAHPEARDGIIVHLRNRHRMPPGFQNDNIARLQIHDLFPPNRSMRFAFYRFVMTGRSRPNISVGRIRPLETFGMIAATGVGQAPARSANG